MFVWCAYCQRYTGERVPHDDYSLTHGRCESCVTAELDDDRVAAMRAIASFHSDVLARALAGDDLQGVIARGRALGIRPLELLVGIIQPALYEVGRAWQTGAISPRVEAQFSAACESVVSELERDQVVTADGESTVLMAAHFNRHTLGLRMIAFRLREAGRRVHVLAPTPPLDRLRHELALLSPAIVGVSVATEWQLGFVRELAAICESLSPPPRLIAGGGAVRADLDLPRGVERWRDEIISVAG